MIFATLTGAIVSEPKRGISAKGTNWGRVTVRVGEGDQAVFIGVLAFGSEAEALLELRKGDGVSASGRFKFGTWQRDGVETPSYTLMAARILTAAPPKRERAPRRESSEPDVDPFGDLVGAGDLDDVRPLKGRLA